MYKTAIYCIIRRRRMKMQNQNKYLGLDWGCTLLIQPHK